MYVQKVHIALICMYVQPKCDKELHFILPISCSYKPLQQIKEFSSPASDQLHDIVVCVEVRTVLTPASVRKTQPEGIWSRRPLRQKARSGPRSFFMSQQSDEVVVFGFPPQINVICPCTEATHKIMVKKREVWAWGKREQWVVRWSRPSSGERKNNPAARAWGSQGSSSSTRSDGTRVGSPGRAPPPALEARGGGEILRCTRRRGSPWRTPSATAPTWLMSSGEDKIEAVGRRA
jgi:hypothetical protein